MSESYKLQEYRVGVMIMDVEGKNSDRFRHWVSQAADAFKNTIANTLGIGVELLAFEGPHLMPSAGTYAPLDFLQVGMNEKLERGIHFLLIVTNDIYGIGRKDERMPLDRKQRDLIFQEMLTGFTFQKLYYMAVRIFGSLYSRFF